MAYYRAPQDWEDWIGWLTAGLQGQSQWKLAPLLMGLLFAGGRRVVASWIRTAGLSDFYQDYYYFLQSVGKRWQELGRRVLILVLRGVLKDHQRVLVAIDDSPTKRYGPQVEGAGTHHDPTPGPTGHPFCYGHVWVTLAVVVRHARWGTIGLPIWSCCTFDVWNVQWWRFGSFATSCADKLPRKFRNLLKRLLRIAV